MEVSESDGYTGVYLSMDPWDSMVPEQRHRFYFMHLAPAHTHKLYGSNLTQPECLDVLGEAADVARFCNSNVLLGLKLQDFLLPSDHPEVQKARNQVQAKLDAPTPSRAAAKTRAGGRVNKKVLEMKAAMDEDDVVQKKVSGGRSCTRTGGNSSWAWIGCRHQSHRSNLNTTKMCSSQGCRSAHVTLSCSLIRKNPLTRRSLNRSSTFLTISTAPGSGLDIARP